jgi:alpha-galactosidase
MKTEPISPCGACSLPPLILGNDLTNMSKETLDIIKNKAMIAVDQDSLGVQGLKYRDDGDIEYWFKPLSGGDWAMTVLNRGEKPFNCTINWKDFDFTDQLSGRSTGFGNKVYSYKNLWAPVPANAKEARAVAKASAKALTLAPLTVTIPSHDVLSLRLSPKPVKK